MQFKELRLFIHIFMNNIKQNFTKEINKWIDENIILKSNKRLMFEKLLELNYDYNLIKNKLNINYEECVNNDLLNKTNLNIDESNKKFEINRIKNFSKEINKWINENIILKSNKRLMFEKLLELNYDYNLIKNKLNIDYEECVNNDLLNKTSLCNDEINEFDESIDKNNEIILRNANIINNPKLNIYQINNFLNKEECQKIISNYHKNDNNENEFLNSIEERICKLIGCENDKSEKIYIEKFNDKIKSNSNDFTYIFILYLNNTENENEYLSFPNAYFSDLIKTGNALFWKKNNTSEDDYYEQISKNYGTKYLIKKCFKKIHNIKNLNNHLPIFDNIGFTKIKIDIENINNLSTGSKFQLIHNLKILLLEWIKYKTNLTYFLIEEIDDNNVNNFKDDKNSVISVFINLNTQDNQLWSFKIEDHNYRQHEIILEKGDVILYESSTCKHEINLKFIDNNNKALKIHFKPDQ